MASEPTTGCCLTVIHRASDKGGLYYRQLTVNGIQDQRNAVPKQLLDTFNNLTKYTNDVSKTCPTAPRRKRESARRKIRRAPRLVFFSL